MSDKSVDDIERHKNNYQKLKNLQERRDKLFHGKHSNTIKSSVSTPSQKVKLIIGLGNPGVQYQDTYHNIGHLFVDYFVKKYQLKKEGGKNFVFYKKNGKILVKPLTFMNQSGTATREAKRYFEVRSEEILIVHDDSDIETGKYKLSLGRGSAGHQGVESVIKSLKTKNFYRLRIGVGPRKYQVSSIKYQGNSSPSSPLRQGLRAGTARLRRAKAGDFVLTKIKTVDRLVLEKLISRVGRLYLEGDDKTDLPAGKRSNLRKG